MLALWWGYFGPAFDTKEHDVSTPLHRSGRDPCFGSGLWGRVCYWSQGEKGVASSINLFCIGGFPIVICIMYNSSKHWFPQTSDNADKLEYFYLWVLLTLSFVGILLNIACREKLGRRYLPGGNGECDMHFAPQVDHQFQRRKYCWYRNSIQRSAAKSWLWARFFFFSRRFFSLHEEMSDECSERLLMIKDLAVLDGAERSKFSSSRLRRSARARDTRCVALVTLHSIRRLQCHSMFEWRKGNRLVVERTLKCDVGSKKSRFYLFDMWYPSNLICHS